MRILFTISLSLIFLDLAVYNYYVFNLSKSSQRPTQWIKVILYVVAMVIILLLQQQY